MYIPLYPHNSGTRYIYKLQLLVVLQCFQNNPFFDDEAEEGDDDDDDEDAAPPRAVCAEINDMGEDDEDLFQDTDKLHLRLDVTDDEEENEEEEKEDGEEKEDEEENEDEDSGEGVFKLWGIKRGGGGGISKRNTHKKEKFDHHPKRSIKCTKKL